MRDPDMGSRAARDAPARPWRPSILGQTQGRDPTRAGLTAVRRTVVPLLIMVGAPVTALLVWHTNVALGGSLEALARELGREGFVSTILAVWRPVLLGSPTAWAIIGVFVAVQLALERLLPGEAFSGPTTPTGHVPVYRANGVAAFAITLGLFVGGSYGLGLFSPTIVYDHFGELIGALNVLGLVLCLGLYLKGRLAPSTRDVVVTGNPVHDYFWGTELYPSVAGFNVKRLTNCRFGMMAWPLVILSFAAAQQARHGLADSMVVAVGLQLVYVTKFFWWEPGYLRSLDIMHYRAGFFLCWGCVLWVPTIYTASTLYLVDHPNRLGVPLAVIIAVLGLACIATNYLADAQRQRVRATDGRCLVWGKPPALIRAGGSLLLASGFWGLARHFHYVPELGAAFFWTLPAGFAHALPWLYVSFLALLLVERALGDDARCAAKYGEAWSEYRRRVPSRIVPGVF
jgi:7-dehydrocholesterol reductase